MNMMDLADWNEHGVLHGPHAKEVGLSCDGIVSKAPNRLLIDFIELQAIKCLKETVKSIVHVYKYSECEESPAAERRSLIEYIDSDARKKMSFLFKVFVALNTDENWVTLDDYIFAAMNRIYLKSISLSERCLSRYKYRKNGLCSEANCRVQEFLVRANAQFDVHLHLGGACGGEL